MRTTVQRKMQQLQLLETNTKHIFQFFEICMLIRGSKLLLEIRLLHPSCIVSLGALGAANELWVWFGNLARIWVWVSLNSTCESTVKTWRRLSVLTLLPPPNREEKMGGAQGCNDRKLQGCVSKNGEQFVVFRCLCHDWQPVMCSRSDAGSHSTSQAANGVLVRILQYWSILYNIVRYTSVQFQPRPSGKGFSDTQNFDQPFTNRNSS